MPLSSPETDDATRLVITDQEDPELAAEIMAVYRSADHLASQARTNAETAVQEAIRCGAMLNARKSGLVHGFWNSWLELSAGG